jgi:lipoprotein-anchoring transpeptidase ErfK/SrfK
MHRTYGERTFKEHLFTTWGQITPPTVRKALWNAGFYGLNTARGTDVGSDNENKKSAVISKRNMTRRKCPPMISMRSIRLALCFAVAFVGMVSAANAAVLITIDKSAQRMTVAVDGAVRWTWPVSTGSRGYDTPTGSYTAFRMEKDHFSREWDDAPMPHSIFFTKRGHAIHGSYETKRLGRPVSHGCVRLSPGNAAKLYALVQSEGVSNATVVVTGAVGGRR